MFQKITDARGAVVAILRPADGASIPFDDGNADYRAYLDWVAEGNEAEPVPAPPPAVPESVTASQIIRALDKLGLLEAVKAAVNKAGGLTLELWNRAPFFARKDPLIAGVAAAIGKTDAEVDALFILAATY